MEVCRIFEDKSLKSLSLTCSRCRSHIFQLPYLSFQSKRPIALQPHPTLLIHARCPQAITHPATIWRAPKLFVLSFAWWPLRGRHVSMWDPHRPPPRPPTLSSPRPWLPLLRLQPSTPGRSQASESEEWQHRIQLPICYALSNVTESFRLPGASHFRPRRRSGAGLSGLENSVKPFLRKVEVKNSGEGYLVVFQTWWFMRFYDRAVLYSILPSGFFMHLSQQLSLHLNKRLPNHQPLSKTEIAPSWSTYF